MAEMILQMSPKSDTFYIQYLIYFCPTFPKMKSNTLYDLIWIEKSRTISMSCAVLYIFWRILYLFMIVRNLDKTTAAKELVVDYRRQSREHTPITTDKTPVERVNSFKFLSVHITEDLTWSAHTDAVLKKAHQRLFFLRRLRKFGMSPRILRSFYTCTVESILTSCITAWFGNSTAGNRRALQRVVRTAPHIVGGKLPSLQDIYTRRCTRKARSIIKDSSHPSHSLLSLLPSGRRLRSIRSRTSRLRDSFFPQAIRLMNSQN